MPAARFISPPISKPKFPKGEEISMMKSIIHNKQELVTRGMRTQTKIV